jgi:hypothetical protein
VLVEHLLDLLLLRVGGLTVDTVGGRGVLVAQEDGDLELAAPVLLGLVWGSETSSDGVATYRGFVGRRATPGTSVIRIDFDGTALWGRCTKFVFLKIIR